MSKIALAGAVSGTATFTLESPATSTNRTLTLPDNTGTIITQNSTPAFASTIGVGGATAAASGAGITFPATQSASSNANTLDDYEEGTFTPTISGSTSAGAGSYDVQQGTYTKIGNLVTLNVRMAWSAHTGTGNLEFTNYPFTSINTTNYRASGTFGAFSNIALTANNVALFLMVPNENKSIVSQYPVGGGAPSNVPMDTAGSVHFAITYQTS
jgi:hypothetical protein